MDATTRDFVAYLEADVLSAISAYQSGEYTSIRKCAGAFSIPYPTLQHRIAGRLSRPTSHEHRQILSNAEERKLVRCITQLTNTGFPASPALVVQMADEIRHGRYQLSHNPPSYDRPIGKSWLDRFRKRHPEIQGIWTRKIDGVRHKALSLEVVKTWFEAVAEVLESLRRRSATHSQNSSAKYKVSAPNTSARPRRS